MNGWGKHTTLPRSIESGIEGKERHYVAFTQTQRLPTHSTIISVSVFVVPCSNSMWSVNAQGVNIISHMVIMTFSVVHEDVNRRVCFVCD